MKIIDIKSFVDDTKIDQFNEIPRVLVIIPGIRTNAEWIDHAKDYIESFYTDVIIIKCCTRHISFFDLIFRLRKKSLVNEVRDQLVDIIMLNPTSNISLLCHSYGSDLITDVLLEIDHNFSKIIFIGSVCHEKKAKFISQKCKTFYNFRGRKDLISLLAPVIRPDVYGSTGYFGFNKGVYVIDVIFNVNHYKCTNELFIRKFVIPLINELPINVPFVRKSFLGVAVFYYTRNILYLILAIIFIYFFSIFLNVLLYI